MYVALSGVHGTCTLKSWDRIGSENKVPSSSSLHSHVHVLRIEGATCMYMYSSAAFNIDMNGRICGALVHFGCYQHKHK